MKRRNFYKGKFRDQDKWEELQNACNVEEMEVTVNETEDKKINNGMQRWKLFSEALTPLP